MLLTLDCRKNAEGGVLICDSAGRTADAEVSHPSNGQLDTAQLSAGKSSCDLSMICGSI